MRGFPGAFTSNREGPEGPEGPEGAQWPWP